VAGELLEGDNAYLCEPLGRKVAALKRTCLAALPPTLVVHLKRFEFDYASMTRVKVRERFEFPTRLDAWPYTVEGLAAADGAKAAAAAEAAGAPPPPPAAPDAAGPPAWPREHYLYDLKGVVVHAGSAFAGHYYSFAAERRAEGAARRPRREIARASFLLAHHSDTSRLPLLARAARPPPPALARAPEREVQPAADQLRPRARSCVFVEWHGRRRRTMTARQRRRAWGVGKNRGFNT